MNPTAENWFYSNYIQVSCVNRDHYISRGNEDNALHYGFYNPDITSPEPADHIGIEGCEQLYLLGNINFIKEAINAGWYIYTDADMFFIRDNEQFGKNHNPHDLMIYGYEEKNIYIYMYGETKINSHIIGFNDFLKGYYSEYCNEDCYRNRAILFKPNSRNYTVNVERIRWHIHDYMNDIETFARERPNIFNPDSLTVHGNHTYDEFIKLYDHLLGKPYKFLRRADMYCFYEHKKVMYDRVVYLKNMAYYWQMSN